MDIAVDTSVLTGLLVPDDVWHERAVHLWDALKGARHTTILFDCVTAETVSVAVRRLEERARTDQVGHLLDELRTRVPASAVTWILPEVPRLYEQILELVRSSKGRLNFNDALIALSCRERRIPVIASFDQDFDHVDMIKRLSGADQVPGG